MEYKPVKLAFVWLITVFATIGLTACGSGGTRFDNVYQEICYGYIQDVETARKAVVSAFDANGTCDYQNT